MVRVADVGRIVNNFGIPAVPGTIKQTKRMTGEVRTL